MVRLERLGVIDEIIQASRKGVVVKILSPLSKENTHIVKKIYDNSTTTEILNGNKSPYGMYIVDGERFLRAEVKELQAENFSEAIGRAVYSNSKRSVLNCFGMNGH
jgi:hypothetical protein